MAYTDRYNKAFSYTMKNEGALYVADPSDKGVCSKYGITLASLTAYWKKLARARAPTCADVATLQLVDAQAFYADMVWVSIQGDALSTDGLAMMMFDAATLMGAPQAIKYLQHTVISQPGLKVDGVLGSKTLAVVNADLPLDLIADMSALMGRHCLELAVKDPTQQKFLLNWSLRAGRMLTLALDTTPLSK